MSALWKWICIACIATGCWSKVETFIPIRGLDRPVLSHTEILVQTPLQKTILSNQWSHRVSMVIFFPWYLFQEANAVEQSMRGDYKPSRRDFLQDRQDIATSDMLLSQDAAQQTMALEVLSKDKKAGITQEFWGALSQQSSYVKIVALNQLQNQSDKIAYGIELFNDPDEMVRLVALQELSQFRMPQVLIYFQRSLLDPAPVIRARAAYLLGQIGDKSSIPFIWPLLEDAELYVQSQAKYALEQLTQHSAGYEHEDMPETKRAAILQWRTWWESQTPKAAKPLLPPTEQ